MVVGFDSLACGCSFQLTDLGMCVSIHSLLVVGSWKAECFARVKLEGGRRLTENCILTRSLTLPCADHSKAVPLCCVRGVPNPVMLCCDALCRFMFCLLDLHVRDVLLEVYLYFVSV